MSNLKYQPVLYNKDELLNQDSKRKGFKRAYEELDDEYALVRELLSARVKSGLTQDKVAERMGTTKSAISRLEGGGKHSPSIATLKKYAHAVGFQLEIKLIPKSVPSRVKRNNGKIS